MAERSLYDKLYVVVNPSFVYIVVCPSVRVKFLQYPGLTSWLLGLLVERMSWSIGQIEVLVERTSWVIGFYNELLASKKKELCIVKRKRLGNMENKIVFTFGTKVKDHV